MSRNFRESLQGVQLSVFKARSLPIEICSRNFDLSSFPGTSRKRLEKALAFPKKTSLPSLTLTLVWTLSCPWPCPSLQCACGCLGALTVLFLAGAVGQALVPGPALPWVLPHLYGGVTWSSESKMVIGVQCIGNWVMTHFQVAVHVISH